MSSPTTTPSPSSLENTGAVYKTGALPSHRVIRFVGPDAATFLQGYLSCDTDKLSTQQATPGAFTNLKGRVVANGWVWGSSSDVLILISADLTETIGEFLKMYLNFAKTTLSVAPFAPNVRLGETQSDTAVERVVQLWEDAAVLDNGFTEPASTASTDDLSAIWLDRSIERREVLTTQSTSGSLLPQMLGLVEIGAVSFDKGCYLGQEVVARAQHRGEVKRRLQCIDFSADQPLPAGAALEDQGGKRVAVVINATTNPTTNQALIVTAVDELNGKLWSYAGRPVQLV